MYLCLNICSCLYLNILMFNFMFKCLNVKMLDNVCTNLCSHVLYGKRLIWKNYL